MIAPRVPPKEEIFAELGKLGFEATGEKTDTGEFWRHKASGRHLQVPNSVQGYFPDWLIWQFWPRAVEIANMTPAARLPPKFPPGATKKKK